MEKAGQIHAYRCKQCQGIQYSINLHHGITRTTIPCKFCINSAEKCPPPADKEIICERAWYRPTADEYNRLLLAQKEHVLRGGLLLKPLNKITGLQGVYTTFDLLSDPESWLDFAYHYYNPDMDLFEQVKNDTT